MGRGEGERERFKLYQNSSPHGNPWKKTASTTRFKEVGAAPPK